MHREGEEAEAGVIWPRKGQKYAKKSKTKTPNTPKKRRICMPIKVIESSRTTELTCPAATAVLI
jgi:hypothetical protein